MSKFSEIQNFYQNQKVFITGGTGFVGQVLVEKLLRSTEITSIYFLIRDKKGTSKNERLEKIFENEFFSKLKKECPSFRNRIIPINGDCSQNNLGLSPEDRQELVDNVNIVFHSAATIRFDENIKTAYQINFCATKAIVEMCKEMKNLKVFMYVSTAYSNCHMRTINETVYQHPVDPDELEARLEKLSYNEASEITKEILGKFPNTYIFTKAMAEFIIKKEISHLPVGIFRPPIVTSTYKEPIPAWTCSWAGAIQMSVSIAAGLVRVLNVNKDVFMNMQPADKCIAALIASAWDVAKLHEKNCPNVSVYNFICPKEHGLTYNDFTILFSQHIPDYPLTNAVWTPQIQYVTNRGYYLLLKILLHSIPALLIDLGSVACFRKPTMLATYRKIDRTSNVLNNFVLDDFHFSYDNVKNLWSKMNNDDKELFPFDTATVCWPLFCRQYWPGIRLHLVNQKPDTLDSAKMKQIRFQIANELLKLLLYFGGFVAVHNLFLRARM